MVASMNATTEIVENLTECKESRSIELLSEPERLKAYRSVERWAKIKATG
jgi:hypothetical protein